MAIQWLQKVIITLGIQITLGIITTLGIIITLGIVRFFHILER